VGQGQGAQEGVLCGCLVARLGPNPPQPDAPCALSLHVTTTHPCKRSLSPHRPPIDSPLPPHCPPGTADLIADSFTLTPPKIESYFGITRGHIHHIDNGYGFDERFPYRWGRGGVGVGVGCLLGLGLAARWMDGWIRGWVHHSGKLTALSMLRIAFKSSSLSSQS